MAETTTALTLEQAEALASRTLAAISWRRDLPHLFPDAARALDADRERVASDLDGLREHAEGFDADWRHRPPVWPCADAVRYSEGLRRTAALYGVG